MDDFRNASFNAAYSVEDLYDSYLGYVEFVNGPVLNRLGEMIIGPAARLTAESFEEFVDSVSDCTPADIQTYLGIWTNTSAIEEESKRHLANIQQKNTEWGVSAEVAELVTRIKQGLEY